MIMPGKSSMYSTRQNNDFMMETLLVLNEFEEAVTIDDIKKNSFSLSQLSSQKISRLLSELIGAGLAQKTKSKKLGRMVYKSTGQMVKQGYEV